MPIMASYHNLSQKLAAAAVSTEFADFR